jgi:hypothetical protein
MEMCRLVVGVGARVEMELELAWGRSGEKFRHPLPKQQVGAGMG